MEQSQKPAAFSVNRLFQLELSLSPTPCSESARALSNEQEIQPVIPAYYGRVSSSSGIPIYLILIAPKEFDIFKNQLL